MAQPPSSPTRRTVVVVNDACHVDGGAAQVALASARELARRGHRVILFGAVGPVMPELIDDGVEVVCLDQHDILRDPDRLRAVRQGLWNREAADRMGQVLRTLDRSSTIVHVHAWTKALSSSPVLVAQKAGFPVVCTLHDYFVACPNGGFFDYQRREICDERPMSLGCVRRNCDSRSYPHKLWRVARQHVQRTIGHVPDGISHFIVVSRFSESILREYLPPQARVYLVSNPIEVPRRQPADVAKNRAFAFIGRLAPEKGVAMFAAAARDAAVDATFVGDGELADRLRELHPTFSITGWLPHQQTLSQIASSRAVVVPSLCYETQGLVAWEAAALGVPTIVADTCAARDGVEHERTGLWFRGGDVASLANALTTLADPSVAARMGQAAFERFWRAPPTLTLHVDMLQECYARVRAS